MGSASPQKAEISSQEASQASAASSSRSIYSFWGNGAGPSQPPPPPPPAKRKRKKADDGASQARIGLSAGGEKTWVINKDVPSVAAEETSVQPKGKGKARAKQSGEEDELKEMAKRAKQASAGIKGNTRGRKCPPGSPDAEVSRITEDSSFIGAGSSPPLPPEQYKGDPSRATRPSPIKAKKPGRPKKTATSSPSKGDISPEIIHVLSSDPIQPTSSPLRPKTLARNQGPNLGVPSLSRTASASSRGAFDDPIDVEVEPHRPKKLVFAADNKAAHPLFARVAAKEVNTTRASSGLSDAATSEITGENTSANGKKVKAAKTAKVHAFFSSNGSASAPGRDKTGWGNGIKQGEEWRAPWPTGDFVPPIPSVNMASPRLDASVKRRRISARTDLDQQGCSQYWASYTRSLDTTNRPKQRSYDNGHTSSPQTTPYFVAAHPALMAAKDRRSASKRETWAELYRPMKAAEVLGNEVEAAYLRDWLQTLSVGSTGEKKRPIVRKVNRATGKLFEDWIVDDAGIFGDPVDVDDLHEDEEQVEYVEYDEPDLAFGQRVDEYPSLDIWQLTNTILLTGPNGSGKTAAVYAAATELGWEVFEVNPGMGRRTGANLMSWVGDVGKNHLVVNGSKMSKDSSKAAGALQSFFATNGKANQDQATDDDNYPIAVSGSQGSQADPIHIDESPIQEAALDLESAMSNKVRQSLILIDEADILYGEETTFWPALAALISESRRPVIITCNDIRRIQLSILPMQVILRFQPAPSYLAIPYLESIARSQGIKQQEYGSRLYKKSIIYRPPITDQPLPPNGNEPLPYFDLRHAIMQMQLDRATTCDIAQVSQPDMSLEEMHRAIETASWVDSNVSPRSWALLDVTVVDRLEPSMDDEIGCHALLKPDRHHDFSVLPAYDYTTAISDEALKLAGNEPSLPGELQIARVDFVRSLLPLLDPLIPLSAPLLPSPALFLHYLPVLQDMVEWEDVLEADKKATLARGEVWISRKTGRPIRSAQGGEPEERYLTDVEEDGLQAARSSRLPPWITYSAVFSKRR